LQLPNAECVRRVQDLLESGLFYLNLIIFVLLDDLGASIRAIVGNGSEHAQWEEAFWCSTMIAANTPITFGLRRVYVFTNNDTPHQANKQRAVRDSCVYCN
jgi:hypothetical protein